ncbi:MAG TPA: Dna2/Cas4 domain-containing protein [Methanoregulaceae archaeon]|nr:Dna2/Cas4 domain-containing protein [Methanoregulaceae archaeon]
MHLSRFEETPGYTVCKQVSYHLGEPLSYTTIWDEIIAIAPAIGEPEAALLETCVSVCNEKVWRIATDHDVSVRSEKYGLFGVVDRMFEEPPYFSIVRPVPSPKAGIYLQDRIRITAYSLCLSEMLGEAIGGGNVEYIPDGESRFCGIQPGDMRKLYSGLRIARNIGAGSIPKRPVHAPCSSCSYCSRCDSGPKSLSERFHDR